MPEAILAMDIATLSAVAAIAALAGFLVSLAISMRRMDRQRVRLRQELLETINQTFVDVLTRRDAGDLPRAIGALRRSFDERGRMLLANAPLLGHLDALADPERPTPAAPHDWHARRFIAAGKALEACAEGPPSGFTSAVRQPEAAAFLRRGGAALAVLPADAQTADIWRILFDTDPGQCDALLAAALLAGHVPMRSTEDRLLAERLRAADQAVRELLLDRGLTVDRPIPFVDAAKASSGFGAEIQPGGARRLAAVADLRERAMAAADDARDPDRLVVNVVRFGVRSENDLIRTTLLAGYSPAEWRNQDRGGT
jgi:hypothetical protein